MSNICKTVSLRTRKIKDGHMLSYYLDYYPGYRDESTMKVIRHESLGIYIYAKPKKPDGTEVQPQPYGKSRGDTLPSLRVYCQRALRFLRQGEDERRFPCLLQETGRQEELQVATRLYALSYLHARQVYLQGDKRGLVQQISRVSADSTTGTA